MAVAQTFLQLVQALAVEVRAAGNGPTTVVGQTGEYARLVKWVADADMELQQEHDNWRFMANTFTLNTVVGDDSYAAADCIVPVTDLRMWRERTIKCYLLSAGVTDEGELGYIDYEAWDWMYNTGPQTNSRPIHYTVGDAMELLIGPLPMDVYRISGKYQRSVTKMALDADTPRYPAEFHSLAVYLAMVKYGRFTGAVEVMQDGDRLYKKMMNRMERTQLPRMNHRLPLA